MDNPRAEKVAVVDEVRSRLEAADASVVTEYRGLSVKEIAQLRRSLTAAGGDYKIFKNTLVRRAVDGSAYAPLEELLTGPTAIAFVHGDVSAVAKALRDFSRTNAHLVVKGGLLDGSLLSTAQLGALAELPSRDVLLAQMAGAIQAPLSQLAGLMQALTRNLAYGLKALLDERGGAPVAAAPSSPPEPGPSAPPAPAGADDVAAPETEVSEGGPQAAAPEAPAAEAEATDALAEPPSPASHDAAPEDAAPSEEPSAEEPEPEAGD